MINQIIGFLIIIFPAYQTLLQSNELLPYYGLFHKKNAIAEWLKSKETAPHIWEPQNHMGSVFIIKNSTNISCYCR